MEEFSGKKFIDRIDLKLKERGEVRKNIADAISINKTLFSNCYARDNLPTTYITYCIAKYLNVTMEWLVTGEDPNIQAPDTNPQLLELTKAFRKLNNQNKETILAIIHTIAKQEQQQEDEDFKKVSG